MLIKGKEMKKILLSLVLMLMAVKSYAVPTPTPAPAPPHGENVFVTGGTVNVTGGGLTVIGGSTASNQATQIALEATSAAGITQILSIFGTLPSPTATPITWAALRNQVLFKSSFNRPDTTNINASGSNNSQWIIAPGASIGVTNGSPYVVVSAGNDSILQDVGIPNAFVEITMTQEYLDGNVGLNLRMLSDTDGIEVDNLNNGSLDIYNMAVGPGNAQTRFNPGVTIVGNKLGVEIKGRLMSFYINSVLIDTVDLDTAGFDNHLDNATKYGMTLYGDTSGVPKFTDFIIEPFKQEFINPTPTPTPFVASVLSITTVNGVGPVTLAVATPGWKHDLYLNINNAGVVAAPLGDVKTGTQHYLNWDAQPALGLQGLWCLDANGNGDSIYTGTAGVTVKLSGLRVDHP
jgi:hypothetical protein